MRRYPRIDGPAALPLFCLAPHGVFPASRITPRAVSSYLAFSPLPALFSKNRRSFFCDTFRQRSLARTLPASFTRHAAVWCSDFPPASLAAHQRSSAIATNLSQTRTWESGLDVVEAFETSVSTIPFPMNRASIRARLLTGFHFTSPAQRFPPMREEEFFLGRKKCFRRGDDRTQRGGHLETNHHKNQAPKLHLASDRPAQ